MEPEDDYGNTEYKYKLCDLTMYKIDKRTTQMRFRLVVSEHFILTLLLNYACASKVKFMLVVFSRQSCF